MELAWDDFKELIIKQQSFVYQLLVPQHKIQGSLTLSNTIIYHFGIIYKCNASTRNLTWHYRKCFRSWPTLVVILLRIS
jgi:hypothetical protein